MSYILPSNKFELLVCPVISLTNNNSTNTSNKTSNETFLYEKLKNNYKSFFNNSSCDLYKENNFEEQLNYLYEKTMDNYNITNHNYNNSMFYEINEFIIKHNIFKNNIFKKNNVFIISKNIKEILDALKQNNVEYENYFTFSSFTENFSININQFEHIFDFIFFDILLEENNCDCYQKFITSIMVILNYLKKGGKCLFKINLEILSNTCDFTYFLSYLFENIYIIQLESSNSTTIFIYCNELIINEQRIDNYNKNLIMFFFLLNKLKSSKTNKFISLFQTNIPYFFNTKLNNIKNIILQQKMEIVYNLNNYFYSNIKSNTAIENINLLQKLKQINTQKIKKTLTWCKKYNVACSL